MKQKVCPVCDTKKYIKHSFTTPDGIECGVCSVCKNSYGLVADSERTNNRVYIKHGLTINGRTARRKFRFVKVKKS